MQVKVLTFNKHASSIEAFEEQVRQTMMLTPEAVTNLQVAEHIYNGDIHFVLQFAGKKTVSQDFCILGFAPIERIETILNSTLEGMISNRLHAKHINILATTKSQRAIAALIVEQSEADSADHAVEAEHTPKEQDENEAPQTKSRRQRKTGNRN